MPTENPLTKRSKESLNDDVEQRVPLISFTPKGNSNSANDIPFADDLNAVDSKSSSSTPTNKRAPKSPFATEFCVAKNNNSARRSSQKSTTNDDDSSESDIDAHMATISRNLRRNSISLPSGINAIELEALRLKHQMVEQEPLSEEEKSASASASASASCSRTESVVDDDINDSTNLSLPDKDTVTPNVHYANEKNKEEDEDSDLEYGSKPKYRDRFRNRRRASIAPLPALRLNSKEMLASDFDTHSVASNQASITSVNSLASLLREKMQVSNGWPNVNLNFYNGGPLVAAQEVAGNGDPPRGRGRGRGRCGGVISSDIKSVNAKKREKLIRKGREIERTAAAAADDPVPAEAAAAADNAAPADAVVAAAGAVDAADS